ncbi:MAG: cysteine desulfurase family protein [Bacteroidia bacterium]
MIYLDYNSTTPVDERVLQKMLPYFTEKFGNAASKTHAMGWIADEAVKHARKQVAEFIGAVEQEIVFTSGATEAINLAIKGIYEAYKSKGNHIIAVKTEHKAVLDTLENLEKKGAQITLLDVDKNGLIDLAELEKSINDKTILVCVMLANNETGVIQPIKEISEIIHKKNSILFCDATQAIGKIPVNVDALGIDALCISAHKFYGPKGVGALYVRRKNPRVSLIAQIDGGGHERGLRSGTLNVPSIIGLGAACTVCDFNELEKIKLLRDDFENKMLQLENVYINSKDCARLPNTSSITIKGIKAEQLISKIPDIAIATGSACTSALARPSHVLSAMGLSAEDAYGSIRISLGKHTKPTEIKTAADKIMEAVKMLRDF